PEIAPTEVLLPEYEPGLLEYLRQLAAEYEILPDRPDFLHKHLINVAGRARGNGRAFTPGELRQYSRAFALRFHTLRGQREGKPVVWPEDLRANGLIERYDAEGRVRPVPWRFGKAAEERDSALPARRVVGAYVGFALGEALGLVAETGRCPDESPLHWGGLTRQLLALSESVIRAFPEEAEPEVVPNSLPVSDGESSWWSIAAGETPPPPAEFATLLTAALPAAAAGNGRLSSGDAFPLAVARELTGSGAGSEVNDSVTVLVKVLFQQLSRHEGYDWPSRVRVGELTRHEQPAISTLATRLLELRNDRTADDEEQLETLGDGRSPLSVLSRALLAAVKRDYDPYTALAVAVNHSGNRPLTGALTGALAGARHGVAGLPEPWVRQLGRLGVVENMAEDIYLGFARQGIWREGASEREEWRKRYPPAS
ncbi:ADP-ribosylglycohydrolase family protein, partial [Amycolatopsis rhizosphaerae]